MEELKTTVTSEKIRYSQMITDKSQRIEHQSLKISLEFQNKSNSYENIETETKISRV